MGEWCAWEENAAKEVVEKLFLTINRQEEKVLRMCFGLEEKVLRLDEIAIALGLTKQRIRSIKANACRKMRHPKRQTLINKTSSVEEELPENPFMSELEEGKGRLIFEDVVADLAVGSWIAKILQGAGIKKIGQLIQLDELTFLNIKGLGQKALEEVRDALKEEGLHFGMTIPSNVAAKFPLPKAFRKR